MVRRRTKAERRAATRRRVFLSGAPLVLSIVAVSLGIAGGLLTGAAVWVWIDWLLHLIGWLTVGAAGVVSMVWLGLVWSAKRWAAAQDAVRMEDARLATGYTPVQVDDLTAKLGLTDRQALDEIARLRARIEDAAEEPDASLAVTEAVRQMPDLFAALLDLYQAKAELGPERLRNIGFQLEQELKRAYHLLQREIQSGTAGNFHQRELAKLEERQRELADIERRRDELDAQIGDIRAMLLSILDEDRAERAARRAGVSAPGTAPTTEGERRSLASATQAQAQAHAQARLNELRERLDAARKVKAELSEFDARAREWEAPPKN